MCARVKSHEEYSKQPYGTYVRTDSNLVDYIVEFVQTGYMLRQSNSIDKKQKDK